MMILSYFSTQTLKFNVFQTIGIEHKITTCCISGGTIMATSTPLHLFFLSSSRPISIAPIISLPFLSIGFLRPKPPHFSHPFWKILKKKTTQAPKLLRSTLLHHCLDFVTLKLQSFFAQKRKMKKHAWIGCNLIEFVL